MRIEIDRKKTAFENAGNYFDRSKKLKKKIAGARAALQRYLKTKPKIPAKKKAAPRKIAPKKWYEKFRWFRTSDNFLVVLGKDAATNELLIKRHTDSHDIVFHADIAGAPFAVIKTDGKSVPKSTLDQTAQFAASYSKAWARGLGSIDIYHIGPDQVTKTAPAGEFLPKGAFLITGKKTFHKPGLQIAIGNLDGELVWGTPDSVRSQTPKFVTIIPGDRKSLELAKKIKSLLHLETNPDLIQKLIPAGKGKLQK